jgi:dephospho-CoA kinase
MRRDQCSEAHARRILSCQPALAQKMAIADDYINNDGNMLELEQLVERLHHDYLYAASHDK